MPRRPDDNPRKYRSPAEHNVHFEDVKMPCADGVHIHGWLMLRTPAPNNPLPTLIYFHGNAGNIGLRIPNALQMMQYLNVNILMVEYRGYGNSDSVSPSEAGLKLDGRAALDFVLKHPNLNKDKIFLFGLAFSLAEYAQQQQKQAVAGVIIENSFMSISAMVDHLMPIVAPLKGLILKMKWDNEVIVPKLQCPVLYLAGAADELVPHQHMLTLHRLSTQSKLNKLHIVPAGTHNDTWVKGGAEYFAAVKSFLAGAIEANSKFPMGGATLGGSSTAAVTSSTVSDMTQDSSGATTIPTMSNGLFGMVKDAVNKDGIKKGGESGKKEL
ncbi:MAG: hypothetical protein SGILL_003734 [Bacillariaceae sp.]